MKKTNLTKKLTSIFLFLIFMSTNSNSAEELQSLNTLINQSATTRNQNNNSSTESLNSTQTGSEAQVATTSPGIPVILNSSPPISPIGINPDQNSDYSINLSLKCVGGSARFADNNLSYQGKTKIELCFKNNDGQHIRWPNNLTNDIKENEGKGYWTEVHNNKKYLLINNENIFKNCTTNDVYAGTCSGFSIFLEDQFKYSFNNNAINLHGIERADSPHSKKSLPRYSVSKNEHDHKLKLAYDWASDNDIAAWYSVKDGGHQGEASTFQGLQSEVSTCKTSFTQTVTDNGVYRDTRLDENGEERGSVSLSNARLGEVKLARSVSSVSTGNMLSYELFLPGATDKNGNTICAGFASPLMLFKEKSNLKFLSQVDFGLSPMGATFWPEKGNNGYFLAIDLNKNNKIDDARELFTHLNHQNAFEQLKDYDTDKNLSIDSKDKLFSNLLLWNDKNGDGVSQQAEISTARDFQLKSIDLNYSTPGLGKIGGRAEFRQASRAKIYTKNKASKEIEIYDIWFALTPDALDKNVAKAKK